MGKKWLWRKKEVLAVEMARTYGNAREVVGRTPAALLLAPNFTFITVFFVIKKTSDVV